MSGALDSIGDSAIKVGTALTAATAPIAGFFATALKQASDQQTALSQLNAVIKSTGGAAGVTAQMADELSSSLSKVTRFSDDAVLGAENMLLTFTSIGKDIFPDVTKTVLDLSTALGQDLKSSAIQVGKALNDPLTGLTALRRVGVQFTDDQQKMIEGLVKTGNLAQAQTLILKELQREFGGSAEAAGNTFAGSLDRLNHRSEELQEKVGFLLMPLIQRLSDLIGRVIDTVTDWTNKNPELTRTIVAIGAGLVALGPALVGIGGAIKLVTEGIGLAKIALTALTGPVGIVIAAVSALALAYSSNFLGLRDTVQPILEQLGKGFKAVGDAIGLFIGRFKEGGLIEALSGLFSVFEDGSSTISTLLQAFGLGKTQADQFAQGVSDAFGKLKPILEAAQNVVSYFVAGFGVGLNDLVFHATYIFGGLWNKIQTALQPILTWFNGTGPNTLNGALSGIAANLDFWVISPIKGIWAAIQPTLNAIVGWFTGSGPNSFTGAVQTAWNFINTTFITPLAGFWDNTVRPAFDKMTNFLSTLWSQTLEPALHPIIQFFTDIYNTIADTVERVNRLNPSYTPHRTLPEDNPNSAYRGATQVPMGVSWKSFLGDITGGGFANMSYQLGAAAYDFGALIGSGLGQLSNLGTGTPFVNRGTAFHDYPGSYRANTPYLIGTGAQPEVFIPSSSGYAIPNADQMGGSRFVWNGNLVVPPNSSINVTREQVYDWMDAWAEEAGIYD